MLSFGFGFKEANTEDSLNRSEGKIKVKVNYTEGPNIKDFFNTELGNYLGLGLPENLQGIWRGTYDLKKESVYWISPTIEKHILYRKIGFGPYNIKLKLNVNEKGVLNDFDISQEDIGYRSVNIEWANDKQINYWAKANTKNWLEVVRGKILRVSNNELYTEFQTTVYESKTPIYAFNGNSVLQRVLE